MSIELPPTIAREKPINIAILAEGVIAPDGNNADESWENTKAMKCCIVPHRYPPYTEPGVDEQGRTKVQQIRAVMAGVVKDFDPIKALVETGFVPRKEVQFRLGRYAQLANAAAFEALSKIRTSDGQNLLIRRPEVNDLPEIKKRMAYQWRVNRDLIHPNHFAVYGATGFGGGDESAVVSDKLKAGLIPDDDMMRSLSDRLASTITQSIDVYGGSEADTAACASSGKSMVNAINAIIGGYIEAALVVGSEAVLDKPIASAMFDSMGALDPGTYPIKVSRSLHRERNGFVMAEGAVAFVIADYDWAAKNKLPVLYRIIGIGNTSGAGHNTEPNTAAQEMAMLLARSRAERFHGPIAGKLFVSGHFTGTRLGELSEVNSTLSALGDLSKERIIFYASKRANGHMLGAAGNKSLSTAGNVLRTLFVPGMKFDGPIMDELAGYNVPQETYYDPDVTDVVTNQFGFGDSNVTLWLRRV